MSSRRVKIINSLLRGVISDVRVKEVKNPHLASLISITEVDITSDLRQAKVYVSVLGSEEDKTESLKALKSAAGFIAIAASKQVRMRFFPDLTFHLDTSVDDQIKIEKILSEIKEEKKHRDES